MNESKKKSRKLDPTAQLQKEVDMYRSAEMWSYQDLDKIKVTVPTLSLAAISFLASSRQFEGWLLPTTFASALLCYGVTALSIYAAAQENRVSLCKALTSGGLPSHPDLNKVERFFSKQVQLLNMLSIGLALVSIFFVWILFSTAPVKTPLPTRVILDESSIQKVRQAMSDSNNSKQTTNQSNQPIQNKSVTPPDTKGIRSTPRSGNATQSTNSDGGKKKGN